MTAEKGRLFSIGQFAALHGVNKKTLMWYDEIGLFCPAVVKENGYRYYTYFQSATLEAILLLRELDVPVARIRSFLDDRSAQSLAALWDEQLDAVDRKLARLKELRRTMQAQANETKALLELDTGSIEIVTCPPERLILLPTTREAGWEQDIRTLFPRSTAESSETSTARAMARCCPFRAFWMETIRTTGMSSCAFRHPAGNAANTKNRAADICARITGEMSTAYPSAIRRCLRSRAGGGFLLRAMPTRQCCTRWQRQLPMRASRVSSLRWQARPVARAAEVW